MPKRIPSSSVTQFASVPRSLSGDLPSPADHIESSSLGERMSPVGRAIRVAFLLLTLVSVTLVHQYWLPLGPQAVGHAFTNLIGQEVRWTMFSLDPRATSLDLWAEIEYEDGTSAIWTIDRSGGGGDFGFYRMRQWMESAVLDPKPGSIEKLANWLAATSLKPVARISVWTSQQKGVPPGEVRPEPDTVMIFSTATFEVPGDG